MQGSPKEMGVPTLASRGGCAVLQHVPLEGAVSLFPKEGRPAQNVPLPVSCCRGDLEVVAIRRNKAQPGRFLRVVVSLTLRNSPGLCAGDAAGYTSHQAGAWSGHILQGSQGPL